MGSLFTRVLAAVTAHVMRNGMTLYFVGSWLVLTLGTDVVNNPQSVSDLFDSSGFTVLGEILLFKFTRALLQSDKIKISSRD